MRTDSTRSKSLNNDDDRRRTIVVSALACFLKFGYAKTSLDDIAQAASLSRPLLYLKFKNKESIFKAVFDHVIGNGYELAKEAVNGPYSKKEALFKVYEELILKPWDIVMGHPMSTEFYETCDRLFPEVSQKHEKKIWNLVLAILGTDFANEVFFHAAIGLQSDLPTTGILRKRLKLLIEKFT